MSPHGAVATHVGYRRKRNEDSFLLGANIAVIADGMGGHVAGDIASQTAIAAAQAFDEKRAPERLPQTLGQAVHAASRAIQQRVTANPELGGMGTTLVAIMWSGSHYALASIGDSRAYLFRDGTLTQLTDDHLYSRLMAGSERVPNLPDKLSRFLDGRVDGRSPDIASLDVQPGDRLLLCSDGLSSYVPHETVQTIIAAGDAPSRTVDQLVQAALEAGGEDNVTVIVLDVPGSDR
jgi:serine/threonine protein phosphatase PrpC